MSQAVDVAASPFARKSIDDLTHATEDGDQLKRSLGPASLVAIGIGCIIGAGLFSLTGLAAADNAGPAVVLSFLVAGFGCALAGLCYSELASMIPVSGSAYTYAYATMGELVAWIIGWDLVLEYAVGAATVAVSWSGYLASLTHGWGLDLPPRWTSSPFTTIHAPDGSTTHGIVNAPAIFIIIAISLLLMRGISEAAWVNNTIVVVKLCVVAAVIGFGVFYIDPANYHPFIPANTGEFGHFGLSGIMRGAGTVFFAYLGFDAVSTTAQEANNPQRDMPIGILGSLVICTVLYVAFALVLTGLVSYTRLGNEAPVATAIAQTPFPWLQALVKLGIIAGFTSVLLVSLLGQSRIVYAMARDHLLPPIFARISPATQTPWRTNALLMLSTGALAGTVPIAELGHMTSIGTLLAFSIVCGGVLILRHTDPDRERGFRVPWSPLLPTLGILMCAAMMLSLDILTWARLGVWLALGLVVYVTYSRRHSLLARQT